MLYGILALLLLSICQEWRTKKLIKDIENTQVDSINLLKKEGEKIKKQAKSLENGGRDDALLENIYQKVTDADQILKDCEKKIQTAGNQDINKKTAVFKEVIEDISTVSGEQKNAWEMIQAIKAQRQPWRHPQKVAAFILLFYNNHLLYN